jgi:cytochrome oxidase Cu insertion factor (SCO1/SenC/PrrC family)
MGPCRFLPGPDQDNQNVTLASLRGSVWIADVIFTRCAGQCPIMSAHMQEIQDSLPAGLPVKLVSFTTDPAYDTPAVLKKYAARYERARWPMAFPDWQQSRPPQRDRGWPETRRRGQTSSGAGQRRRPFHPQQKLVVIDQDGRIRGYFDGETRRIRQQALAAAKTLARR